MSQIFGHLNVSDSDRVYNSTVGQQAIFEAATAYVDQANADLSAAMSVFLEEETSDYKRRYKLPGAGFLQKRGSDGRYAAVKAVGEWDIALPLEDFGAQIAGNDVDMRYLTIQELDRHLQTVVNANTGTVRYLLLKALLNNAQDSFVDQYHGTLLVEPLANGDAVVYPPVLGSSTEAIDNHYLESGYIASAIDDTHNPFPTIKNELEEHFGVAQGGSNIVTFIHSDQRAKVEALANFTEVVDPFIKQGVNTATVLPFNIGHPGVVVGRCDGVWVVEWRWMPTGYIYGQMLGVPAPIMKRHDPEDTGLGKNLQLIAQDMEFPFTSSFWRHRLGLGVGNRLNGVVMELAAGGTYTVPTMYQ